MKHIRMNLQHRLNPLHVYCLLVWMGMRKGRGSMALRVSRVWEHAYGHMLG